MAVHRRNRRVCSRADHRTTHVHYCPPHRQHHRQLLCSTPISLAPHRLSALIHTSPQVWRCDEISFVLNSADALNNSYPQCAPAGGDPAAVRVAIRAAVNGDSLGLGSSVRVTWGMSLWVAIVIHALGVEIYVCAMDILQLLAH